MKPQGIFSAILVGLVIGALGRLVVPGRQTIGVVLTIILGLVGAFGGGYLAYQFTNSFLPVLIVQVAVAAILIALFASASRGSRRT